MDSDLCLLCDKPLNESETRKIGERAISTLITSSERRRDKKHVELQKHTSITVHGRCLPIYNRESNIQAASKTVTENIAKRRRLVKEERQFDFSSQCLFCGLKATPASKKKFSVVKSDETKATILEKLEFAFDDEVRQRIAARLKEVNSLVEVEARYHCDCMANFYRDRKSNVVGRPLDDEISNITTKVINFILENDHESQFSLKEILEIETLESLPSVGAIKRRLLSHFKNDIVFYPKKNDLVICFRDAKNKIISDAWYNERSKNEAEERERIVNLAANIILQDIRSTCYNLDNYKLPTSNAEDLFRDMPPTLTKFLDVLIKSNKKIETSESKNQLDRRVAAFGHGLISCVRPRSFLSPLQLGLSVMMHKKYASNALVDSLSYLGFCAPYDETLLFESSVVHEPQVYHLNEEAYDQFIFDNADHNTNTLDGSNASHAMGGIMCVTPNSSVRSEKTIPRLKKIPSAED